MARVIFEGFKTPEEAKAFGMKVLTTIQGYRYAPASSPTYDGDLMCEVTKKDLDSNMMTLMETKGQ